jgi:hypothetical protein
MNIHNSLKTFNNQGKREGGMREEKGKREWKK